MRKPQGSATEFNRQITHDLSLPPVSAEIAAAAKSGGLSALTSVRDRIKRASLGRGTGQLADMFLAPDSVEQMRGVAARAAEAPMADGLLRQLMVTTAEGRSASTEQQSARVSGPRLEDHSRYSALSRLGALVSPREKLRFRPKRTEFSVEVCRNDS
ncbi:hypothetical protein CVM73_18925 [Bradyrhizobium forestalis]|uniref:Uncharacterized protein n=1 Tax=Bradyrhizobium forestalis TaxID=1419263 RepID=A0A2M8R7I2_9BRAD|nr:hypothetical protein [Bradyrhizobium forestalis]PJG53791.1 hypothetical protein CVM73_18925 [Bradyrhizobium forestalis]